MTTRKPIAFITGASSGLGQTFAQALAQTGYDLVLLARRKDKLINLKQQLSTHCQCQIITADLAQWANPQADRSILPEHVDLLVCNAGYGLGTSIEDTSFDDIHQQVNAMVLGHLALIHHYLPKWIAQRSGQFIMVASLAATTIHPGPLYGGIKAYQHHFTLNFHARYKHLGLHALSICPGLIHTEFHRANGTYTKYSRIHNIWWMTADHVVKKTLVGLKRKQTSMIIGWQNKLIYGFMTLLPIRARQWLTNRLAQKTTM